jgi:iron complex outermembrane receptor protein
LYVLNGSNPATFVQQQVPNPNLKWESTSTFNAGLDFSVLKGKITGSVDYFNRNTKDILFAKDAADPVTPAGAIKWVNLDANLINSGLEIALNTNILKKADFSLDVSGNVTFLKNELKNFIGEIPTGEVNGQGLSGAYSQLIKSGYAINSFYLKKFIGIDKASGISSYQNTEEKFFMGSANPKMLLGVSTTAMYKKLSLEINMNGAFGHYLYNNTANAITSFNNIGKRNIGLSEYKLAKSGGEKPVNPTSASSRYLEKGNYLKMSNVTLSYNVGNLGKSLRNANVFVTGQNLFVITKFTGFDPEVNVSKPMNGIQSFGMEYTPYPTARTFNVGINFSL